MKHKDIQVFDRLLAYVKSRFPERAFSRSHWLLPLYTEWELTTDYEAVSDAFEGLTVWGLTYKLFGEGGFQIDTLLKLEVVTPQDAVECGGVHPEIPDLPTIVLSSSLPSVFFSIRPRVKAEVPIGMLKDELDEQGMCESASLMKRYGTLQQVLQISTLAFDSTSCLCAGILGEEHPTQ